MPVLSYSRVIDLTRPITPESPSPVKPCMERRILAEHGPNSPYQMMWFGMNDHTGTHMDAPLHFVPGGPAIEDLNLAALCFMPGIFLDFTTTEPFFCIDAPALEAALSSCEPIPEGAFIMVHTGQGWHSSLFGYFDSPYLTHEAALLLAALHPAAVGVNGPTVDDRRAKKRPVHRCLLERGIGIVEGVFHSELLKGQRFHCSALPLSLPGFTGSPLRLVAFCA